MNFNEILSEKKIGLLKDDGCNTNKTSKHYVRQNQKNLHDRESILIIGHSEKNSTKDFSEIVIKTFIKNDDHNNAPN